MGGYERNPAPWAVQDGPPADFNHQLLPDDWDRFESLAENAHQLVPALQTAEVVTMINGPEAFTPDGEFILGESDVRGFFVAAGFCAHGIAGAGGIGKVMADWIVDGEPEYDVWKMDIRRFGAQYRSRHYAPRARVRGLRDVLRHPLPRRGAAGGPAAEDARRPTAAWSSSAPSSARSPGWERANWFRRTRTRRSSGLRPRGWAGEHWSTAIAAEHIATRERAGLFDESSFAKIEVSGPGRARASSNGCARTTSTGHRARSIYTQMLNDARRHRMRPDRHPARRTTASCS